MRASGGGGGGESRPFLLLFGEVLFNEEGVIQGIASGCSGGVTMLLRAMPTLLTDAPQIPLPPVPPRKRWTREECAPLEAAGLFERERLELVDGELISKMGRNRPHVNALTAMPIWLQSVFGHRFVNTEAPIDVSPGDNAGNEPEPDLIVLKREYASFDANPQPEDRCLVFEEGVRWLRSGTAL